MNDIEQLKKYIEIELRQQQVIVGEPSYEGMDNVTDQASSKCEVLEDLLMTIETIKKNSARKNPYECAICEDVGMINYTPTHRQVPGVKTCPYCFKPDE